MSVEEFTGFSTFIQPLGKNIVLKAVSKNQDSDHCYPVKCPAAKTGFYDSLECDECDLKAQVTQEDSCVT